MVQAKDQALEPAPDQLAAVHDDDLDGDRSSPNDCEPCVVRSPVATLPKPGKPNPHLPSTPHPRSEVDGHSFSFVAQSGLSEGQCVSEARSFADQIMFSVDSWCAVPRASRCDIECFSSATLLQFVARALDDVEYRRSRSLRAALWREKMHCCARICNRRNLVEKWSVSMFTHARVGPHGR